MLPQWTQAVKLEDGTRDPLGLDRAYDRFSEWLLPGITTITPRARYFTFYLWTLRDARERDKVTNDRQLAESMRRREAAYVLANMAEWADTKDDVYGLIGTRKGRHVWYAGEEQGQFSTDFQPVRKVLGGFDQAYGGSLLKLGLWHRTEATNALNQPTEKGELLAQAYEKSISKTRYFNRLQAECSLRKADLDDYAQAGGLNQLAPAGEEAQLLTALFFNHPPFESASGEYRQASLLLALHIMREVGNITTPMVTYAADDLWVEQAGYFQAICGEDERVHPLTIPAALTKANNLHAVLQMHRYLAFALEHLMSFVLERASRGAGETLQSMIEEINWPAVAYAFRPEPAQSFSDALASWVDALRQVALRHGEDEDVVLPIDHPASEFGTWFDLNEATNDVEVGYALRLIFAICLRAQRMSEHQSLLWLEAVQVAGDGLWTHDLLAHLERGCQRGWTIKQYLGDLLNRYVIVQHDRVRQVKGTFAPGWLEQDASGNIRKLQDLIPRYRGTRLRSASTILMDLGLLEADDNRKQITRRGKRLLEQELREVNRHD